MEASELKTLKSLGHHLKPLVIVGHKGITDTLIQAVSDELERHELIKVKFNDHKDEKKELAESLASTVDAEVVSVIGHNVLLFRQNKDEDKRIIRF